MRRLLQLLVPSVLLGGCFGPGEGLDVPEDEIYFPVGLAMDASGQHLFVVSSDFDLQYNGGAIQSYRLGGDRSTRGDGLFEQLPLSCSSDQDCASSAQGKSVCDNGLCVGEEGGSPCPGDDERSADQRVLYPGRCSAIAQKPLIKSIAKIGAFATDVVLRQRPDGVEAGDPERLFIPVRGDTTLHWIDTVDGELRCGQANNDGACDDQHRAGDDAAAENARDLELQTEPFAIDANERGTTIVVSNQTSGTASLFVNDWGAAGPKLRFALSSERIPSRPVAIANLPLSALASDAEVPSDAFLVSFRNAAQVRLVRFAADHESVPDREYLVDGGGVSIDANSAGNDSRGLAVDASTRKAAEARCQGDAACLSEAALIPLDVYVANRSPASLLIGRTRPPQEYPYFFDSLPLTIGPSRVVVGRVRTPSGEEETRVFVICFDSRRIFVYDPQRSRFETEIFTGRGPHAVVVDTARSLLYVGHFTDSFIGVFSLDLSSPATYGTMLGTLGTPKAPRSSK
jgi:hypothetical protein